MGNANYNAAARVLDPAACTPLGIQSGSARQDITVSRGTMKVRMDFEHAGSVTVRARDIRGSLVWERSLPAGTTEVALDNALESGMYNFEFRSGKSVAHHRVMLP